MRAKIFRDWSFQHYLQILKNEQNLKGKGVMPWMIWHWNYPISPWRGREFRLRNAVIRIRAFGVAHAGTQNYPKWGIAIQSAVLRISALSRAPLRVNLTPVGTSRSTLIITHWQRDNVINWNSSKLKWNRFSNEN